MEQEKRFRESAWLLDLSRRTTAADSKP